MNSLTPLRRSLSDALGLPCAVLSLVSGAIGLATAIALWWRVLPSTLDRIGVNAGLFSAAVGIALSLLGFSCSRRLARRIALAAIIVNFAILGFILDIIFQFSQR